MKLEKLGVLDNYIYDNMEELFSVLDNTGDDNTIYRVLSCLEHMSNENNCILNSYLSLALIQYCIQYERESLHLTFLNELLKYL